MKNNLSAKIFKEEKRNSIYYLMRDILSAFPDKFENNFLGVINHHLIAKEATRQILIDEIKKPKPQFWTLAGSLILQNSFLKQMQRIAIYEVIDIVDALRFCFYKTSFKIIKKLSAEVILRLFATLYFEYKIMPGRKKEGKPYIDKFSKFFSQRDMVNAMNTDGIYPQFIFERHGIDLGYGKESKTKFKKILNNFYFISTSKM